MNRFVFAAESVTVPALPSYDSEVSVESRVARHCMEHEASEPFATFAPMHYEAGYAYPLVVWLHSGASNERELRTVMPLLSMRNYVAIAPRANTPDRRRQDGYRWQQLEESIEAATTRVADCIDIAARRFHVHSSRVFLAGCGSGGTMALRVAWSDPQRFAGVVSFNGPAPKTMRPLSRVKDLRNLPCLLATSQRGRHYSPEQVCGDLRLLHAAGCTVALRQYPGNEQLTDIMLADMNRWVMELVCNGSR